MDPGRVARVAVGCLLAWIVLCYPANVLSPFVLTGVETSAISEAVIFAVIGLSLNVLIGYVGTISLGHQAFVGIGAFTSAYVVTEMGQEFWIAALVASLVGAAQAALLGAVSLRVTGLYFGLITLSYGIMAQESIFQLEWLTGGTAGQPAPRPLGFEGDSRYYYLCLLVLGLVLFLDWRLTASKGGRAMQALRENPRVAATWGVNVKAYTVLAFAVSGLFAGLGGSLLAHRDTNVVANPFGLNLALVFILMTVVGGLRNRAGVVVGSAFFALLRNGELLEVLRIDQVFAKEPISLTAEVMPLVLGPILLLVTITRFPGGFGQLTSTIGRWLAGGPFRWVQAEKEVQVSDVRADDRTTLLETRDVSIRFGGVQALRDVNLRIDQWEIVGIIGPNGAGKTTLFNCITGFYEPTSGRVRYRDRDVTDLPVHKRTELGIGRTFQNVGLVKGSTALENLKTAQHLEVDYDPVAGIFGSPRTFEVERHTTERARAILDLMGLSHLEGTRVQGLPYGVLKRLELAAVLATDPDLLLLDEPGSGMGPEEADELGDLLLRLREEFELTIVMIDHHVPLVTRISDYMYCLNFGEVLAEGMPDDVRRHPEVVRAYLGDDPEAVA